MASILEPFMNTKSALAEMFMVKRVCMPFVRDHCFERIAVLVLDKPRPIASPTAVSLVWNLKVLQVTKVFCSIGFTRFHGGTSRTDHLAAWALKFPVPK